MDVYICFDDGIITNLYSTLTQNKWVIRIALCQNHITTKSAQDISQSCNLAKGKTLWSFKKFKLPINKSQKKMWMLVFLSMNILIKQCARVALCFNSWFCHGTITDLRPIDRAPLELLLATRFAAWCAEQLRDNLQMSCKAPLRLSLFFFKVPCIQFFHCHFLNGLATRRVPVHENIHFIFSIA